jgi:hypothetical protein
MPKIVETEGYSVLIYTRGEHPPAHVHVEHCGSKIKIIIYEDAVEYHSFKGAIPKNSEVKKALEIVAQNLAICWIVWRKYNND